MRVTTYPFRFKVNCLSIDNETYEETGMGICTGFSNAAAILEERYRDELISIVDLSLFESDCLILMSEEMIEEYENTY